MTSAQKNIVNQMVTGGIIVYDTKTEELSMSAHGKVHKITMETFRVLRLDGIIVVDRIEAGREMFKISPFTNQSRREKLAKANKLIFEVEQSYGNFDHPGNIRHRLYQVRVSIGAVMNDIPNKSYNG